MKNAGPNYSKVGEPHHLIHEDHLLVIVLLVVEDEEILKLYLLVGKLRLIDEQTGVHDQP